jgi:hypothetical protein
MSQQRTNDARGRYASMVLDARLFAHKQALGLELAPEERQRLEQMPEDVQHAIKACKRYQSDHLQHMPKNIWGFKAVMEAITRHAGCRPTTLYVWTQDLAQGTLQRQSVRRLKEDPCPPPVQS